jgi:hypothetical protein
MAKYHIGKGTVLDILHEAGVIRRQRRASEAQMKQAANLYAQGWSLTQIGEHFGFDDSTVWLWLKGLGVPRRRPWESSDRQA